MKKITIAILGLALLLSTSSTAIAGNSITNRLKGRLLLQVEDRGRIWYVDPVGEQKHEVTFANALNLFETLSLGISDSDLNQIAVHPDSVSDDVDTDNDGYSDRIEVINGYNPEIASDPSNVGNDKVNINSSLTDRLKGKILLQVQDRGRIWHIDSTGKRWEITWGNLMNRFRKLALGITDKDLGQIGVTSNEQDKKDSQLIYGNYEQLVLTENDVSVWSGQLLNDSKSKIALDPKESKEIKNIEELETTDGINIIGGYQNIFVAYGSLSFGDMEADEELFSVIMSRVFVMGTVDDAKRYFEFKKTAIGPIENVPGVGDECFASKEFGQTFTFRVKNSVGVFSILADESMQDGIDSLLRVQLDKYNNYQPSEDGVINYSLDTDHDGIKNYMEERLGLDKHNADTDGDGDSDGSEIASCHDPLGSFGEKLIPDNLLGKLNDKEWLKTQGLYYFPNTSGLTVTEHDAVRNEKGNNYMDFLIISKENNVIETGVLATSNQRYYIINDSFKKYYFNKDGNLEASCHLTQSKITEQDKATCSLVEDKNNFEIDCKR